MLTRVFKIHNFPTKKSLRSKSNFSLKGKSNLSKSSGRILKPMRSRDVEDEEKGSVGWSEFEESDLKKDEIPVVRALNELNSSSFSQSVRKLRDGLINKSFVNEKYGKVTDRPSSNRLEIAEASTR
jgi:hypothetical protein